MFCTWGSLAPEALVSCFFTFSSRRKSLVLPGGLYLQQVLSIPYSSMKANMAHTQQAIPILLSPAAHPTQFLPARFPLPLCPLFPHQTSLILLASSSGDLTAVVRLLKEPTQSEQCPAKECILSPKFTIFSPFPPFKLIHDSPRKQ